MPTDQLKSRQIPLIYSLNNGEYIDTAPEISLPSKAKLKLLYSSQDANSHS